MQLGHNDVIPPSPPSCIGVEGTVSRKRIRRTSCETTVWWMSTGCAAGWSFLCEWIRGQYQYLHSVHFRATYTYVQVSLVSVIVHRVMTELKHWHGEANVEHIQYSVYKNTPHYMYKLNPILLHALISAVEKVASLTCMMEQLSVAVTPSAPWALHPSCCDHWIIFYSMRKDGAIWANCGLIRLYNKDNYVSAWRQTAGLETPTHPHTAPL